MQHDFMVVDPDLPPKHKQNNDKVIYSDVAQQQQQQNNNLDLDSDVAHQQQKEHDNLDVDSGVAHQQQKEHVDLDVDSGVATRQQQHGEMAVVSNMRPVRDEASEVSIAWSTKLAMVDLAH